MNVKAKRRRSVSEAPRQESTPQARVQEAAGAAEAALPAEGCVVLADHGANFLRLSVPCEPYFPCNPSIAKSPDGAARIMVRAVNYELGAEDGIWFRGDPAPNTVNYIADYTVDGAGEFRRVDDTEVRKSRMPCRDGLEDARLFWFNGRWCFTASGLHHGPRVRTTMAMCTLTPEDRVETLEFLHSPHNREMEKNWMPLAEQHRVAVVYSHHPVESFEIFPAKRKIWLGDHNSLAGWSGGSQLIPYRGSYLGVIHQRRKHKNRVYYVHRLVRYNGNLEPDQVGREFVFFAEQVEFCAGLAEYEGQYVLSFGVKDQEAWLCFLSPSRIAALLGGQ